MSQPSRPPRSRTCRPGPERRPPTRRPERARMPPRRAPQGRGTEESWRGARIMRSGRASLLSHTHTRARPLSSLQRGLSGRCPILRAWAPRHPRLRSGARRRDRAAAGAREPRGRAALRDDRAREPDAREDDGERPARARSGRSRATSRSPPGPIGRWRASSRSPPTCMARAVSTARRCRGEPRAARRGRRGASWRGRSRRAPRRSRSCPPGR